MIWKLNCLPRRIARSWLFLSVRAGEHNFSNHHHHHRRIWEIDWYQNEWPWPLFRGRIKIMPTIALHSTLNISERKPLEMEAWFPKDKQYRKWPSVNQMVTWPITLRDPDRSNSWPNTLRAQYLEQLEMLFSNNRCLLWGACTVGYPSDPTAWLLVDWSTRVTDRRTDEP